MVPTDTTQTTESPGLKTVARLLGMGGGELKQFVDYHPDPSVDALVAVADSDLSTRERDRVDAWLREYLQSQQREDSSIGGDPAGLVRIHSE